MIGAPVPDRCLHPVSLTYAWELEGNVTWSAYKDALSKEFAKRPEFHPAKTDDGSLVFVRTLPGDIYTLRAESVPPGPPEGACDVQRKRRLAGQPSLPSLSGFLSDEPPVGRFTAAGGVVFTRDALTSPVARSAASSGPLPAKDALQGGVESSTRDGAELTNSVSASTSAGFTRCTSNPASAERRRSSSRPHPLTATSSAPLPHGMRRI